MHRCLSLYPSLDGCLISICFNPLAEKLPVDVIFPEHDIFVKVPVPLQVNVGPEIIPELATLLAVNVPALSVPLLVRVPLVVRLTALSAPLLVSVPVVVKLVIPSVVLRPSSYLEFQK